MAKISIHTDTNKNFLQAPIKEMADPAGVIYCASSNRLLFNYLGHPCAVDNGGEISCAGLTLSRNEETLVLLYLLHAKGLPPKHKWISFLELPEGEHHNVPFVIEGTKPLAQTFGNNLANFSTQCQQLGGTKAELADSSFVLHPFPNLPLLIGIYQGDEEFEAKAILLFDAVAPFYLTTAQLWVLGIEVAQRLTKQSRIAYL